MKKKKRKCWNVSLLNTRNRAIKTGWYFSDLSRSIRRTSSISNASNWPIKIPESLINLLSRCKSRESLGREWFWHLSSHGYEGELTYVLSVWCAHVALQHQRCLQSHPRNGLIQPQIQCVCVIATPAVDISYYAVYCIETFDGSF